MVVYRISNNIYQPLERTFTPMVPASIASDEDAITPRVCLSLSIEGCIQAVPYGQDLDKGSRIIVYSAYIDDNDPSLLLPEEVQDHVPDAIVNGECWYTKPLYMTGSLYVIDHLYVYDDLNMEVLNPLYFNGVMRELMRSAAPGAVNEVEAILDNRRLSHTEKFEQIQDICHENLNASTEWQLLNLLDFCQDEMLYTPRVSDLVLSELDSASQIQTLKYRPLMPAY